MLRPASPGTGVIAGGAARQILEEAGNGDFVYLDPPYALGDKRDRGEYGCDAFREKDERRLIASLRAADRRGAKVLLSYSPAETVLQGLKKWRRHDLTVARNDYIQAVQAYNVLARQFPSNLTAMVMGYKPKPNFTVENEAAISKPPVVDFGTEKK